jgi:hypothetical protein
MRRLLPLAFLAALTAGCVRERSAVPGRKADTLAPENVGTTTVALVPRAKVKSVEGNKAPAADSEQPRLDGRAAPEDLATVQRRFKDAVGGAPGAIEPFAFTISLGLEREQQYLLSWQTITLTVSATEMVPWEVGTSPVEVNVGSRPGLIDIATKTVRGPVESWARGKPVPARSLTVGLQDLHLPADRPAYLRLRFQDADEYFALTFEPGRGLRLAPVRSKFGKVKEDAIKEYNILAAADGRRIFRCDNQGIVAQDGEKNLWARRIPLEGAPKEFRVVGSTLFVSSTGGHSLYVRKSDGKIVYYHEGLLAGKAPWEEILAAAQEAYRREGGRASSSGLLCKYVGAAALLNEKRAAPFLIECLEKESGLTAKWWAVAALEHLNGNSGPWKDLLEGQPWDVRDGPARPGEVDYNRVDKGLTAEVRRWEKVFGRAEKPLLTRPDE